MDNSPLIASQVKSCGVFFIRVNLPPWSWFPFPLRSLAVLVIFELYLVLCSIVT